jgi:hypothetical protein
VLRQVLASCVRAAVQHASYVARLVVTQHAVLAVPLASTVPIMPGCAALLAPAALHAVLAVEARGRAAVMRDCRVQIARPTLQRIAGSRVDGRIKESLHTVTLAL